MTSDGEARRLRGADGPRPLDVVHVITGLDAGGAERALLRLIVATRSTVRHTIVALGVGDELRTEFEGAGARVSVLGLGRRVLNPLKLARLVRVIRGARPDVTQTWLVHADLLGGLASRIFAHTPVVWNLRNSELDPARSHRPTRVVVWINTRLSRWIPARIIAVGERAAAVHVAIGYDADRIVVIPNGFNIPQNVPCRAEARTNLGVPSSARVVSRIARFHPDKDHATLIAAMSLVIDQNPDTRLLLAGADMTAANDALMSMIRQYELESSVVLLGPLTDLRDVHAASDIACSSSLAEGLPNVIGEAMAHGVPAVVTDVGDSATLVGDTGVVVTPGSPIALADGLDRLLALDPDALAGMGARARERMVERFSMQSMAESYVSVWTKVAHVRD